jgi:hypothetical protein
VNADESIVAQFLAKKALIATEFQKQERRKGKTPDFRVLSKDVFAFFCEVKSINKDSVMGLREDPTFNRLADDIHTAVKQFDAVNPKVEMPNVLAFVNHDQDCGSLDLVGVLTGNFIGENDKPDPIYKKFSDGRIKDEKARIHLYLWLDDFKPEDFLFNQTYAEFHKQLCAWFEINPNDIQQIRS